jgi:hypothetical protein
MNGMTEMNIQAEVEIKKTHRAVPVGQFMPKDTVLI